MRGRWSAVEVREGKEEGKGKVPLKRANTVWSEHGTVAEYSTRKAPVKPGSCSLEQPSTWTT